MPRPKRNRAPAPKPEPTRQAPSSDNLYDDIDDGKITIVEDNSFQGTGQGIPTHLEEPSRSLVPESPTQRDNAIMRQDVNNNNSGLSSPDMEISRRGRTPPPFGPDMSGLDLDDDMFGADANLDTSFEDDENGRASASKSHNNSSFTISNFRRPGRSRASSFVGGNTASIRPSSRGHNTTGISTTLNLGMFKRREREPSILGTAQKKRSLRPEDDESDSEINDTIEHDDTGGVEDDVTHQDEGTPLRQKKGNTPSTSSLSDIDISDFQSKKRKFSDTHPDANAERPSKVPSLYLDRDDSAEVPDLASSSVPASPRSPSPILPMPNQEEDNMEILAPPASSDSEADNRRQLPPLQTTMRRRRLASRKTPPPISMADDISNLSSPPSLTHSPNYPSFRIPEKPPAPLSTADLAAMLAPRRRRQNVNDDGDDDDDDFSYDNTRDVDIGRLVSKEAEVSHAKARPARQKQQPANSTMATSRKRLSSHGGGPNLATSGSKKRPRRTYGKSSSKENQAEAEAAERSDVDQDFEEGDTLAPVADAEFVDEPSELLEKRVGTELKQAKRKFQEVDQWDLIFEEVTRSSSPVGAR